MSVVVKMNGVLNYVLDPEKATEGASGGFFHDLWSGVGNFSDDFLAKETEWLFKPIGNALKDGFMGVVHLINMHSIEIITLGVIFTAIGMIVAPLMGSKSATWFGRVIFVMLTGSIWRLLLV
jgi:hypothetical protein